MTGLTGFQAASHCKMTLKKIQVILFELHYLTFSWRIFWQEEHLTWNYHTFIIMTAFHLGAVALPGPRTFCTADILAWLKQDLSVPLSVPDSKPRHWGSQQHQGLGISLHKWTHYVINYTSAFPGMTWKNVCCTVQHLLVPLIMVGMDTNAA